MKLRNLIYFIEIEKCGNMSKAAEKLYVSQPALSKGMNELEKELGCQLFIRKASNIVLTEEENRVVLEFILHEGRNRQIRKMCESQGLEVARLKRISIGPVKLGMLKQGDYRELTEQDVKKLLRSAEHKEN